MDEKKSVGGQVFSFVKFIIGFFCTIVIVLLLLIVVPNIIRGCKADNRGTIQQTQGIAK